MPPTPEQLQIDVNQNFTPQPTQVQPVITRPNVVTEGEVSYPTPQQWIGPINYGMNWYALGARAFEVGLDLYPKVLDYQIQKKVGQINDLQFDLETKMRNSYSESFKNPENSSSYPTVDSYKTPFENSDKFQEEYKNQTNEILGIGSRDESGKYIDVFQPEYNLDGLGTKYIQAVTMARDGLQNIADTSEKVQSDLLKVHQKTYEINSISKTFFDGGYVSTDAAKKIDYTFYPFTQGGQIIPDEIQFNIDQQKNITSTGEPIVIVNTNGRYINPRVSQTELFNVMGEVGYTSLIDEEARIANQARGKNLPDSVVNNIGTTLQSSNASPAQIIQLNSYLKYMSMEKMESLVNRKDDYTPTEKARLYRAWDMSQALEPTTPIQYRDELNKITTPTASQVMSTISILRGTYIADNENSLRTTNQKLEIAKAVYGAMVNKVGEEDDKEIQNITDNSRVLQQELANNPALMPALINNLLIFEGVYQNNSENLEKAKQAVQRLGDYIIKDSEGHKYFPRVKGIANQFANIKTAVNSEYRQIASKPDRVIMDPVFKENINKKLLSGQQITFQYGSLQDTVEAKAFPLYAAAVDNSGLIQSNSPNLLTMEARFGIVNSVKSIATNGTSNLSEPITQGELLRVLIATNPAIQKKFNGGIAPKTVQEATTASKNAYLSLGQAEYWSWDDIHNSSKDSFVNSESGGVSFDLSKLTYVNPDTGATENLLKDPNVVYPSSSIRLQFTNQTTGNPLTFISNKNLRFPGYDEDIKSNFKNSMLYGRSHKLEINTGSNVITSDKDVGLQAALSHMSATTPEDYMNINQDIIMNISDMQTVSALTDEITPYQAQSAILDPAFLNTVAVSLNNTYGIPQDTANKILFNVVQDKDLKNMIATKDVNEDGKLSKLDLFSSLHNAVIGYKQNKLEKKPIEFQNMADVYWSGSRSMLGPDGNIGLDSKAQDSNVYGSGTYSKKPTSPLMDEFKKRQSLKYKVNLGLTSGDLNRSSTPTITPVVTPNVSNSDIDTNWGSMLTPKQKEIEWSNSPEGKEILNTFWSNLLKPSEIPVDMEKTISAEIDAARVKAGMRPDQREERQVQKIKQMILDGGDEKNRDPITFKKIEDVQKPNRTISPGAVRGSNVNPDVEEPTVAITRKNFPVKLNEDGSVSTVVSMSFQAEKDGPEILIPTVVGGKQLTEKQAIDRYFKTKEHFGKFSTVEKANAYAKELHLKEEKSVTKNEKLWFDLIKNSEGFEAKAYNKDGTWTIGLGSTTHPNGTPVKEGDVITASKANLYLRNYAYNTVIPTLSDKIPNWYEMNSNQQAALISFAYNMGPYFYGAKERETITEALKSPLTWNKVPAALALYNKGTIDGKYGIQNGLIKRRKAEGNLWNAVVK